MILNETPVRTSKNFGINNIEIENLEILKKIKNFDGLTISGDIADFEISRRCKQGSVNLWNKQKFRGSTI